MNLSDLAVFAAKAATRKSNTPLHLLDITAARAVVKVSNGDKIKSETTQGLKLSFGRRSVSLDAVQTGAAKLVICNEQVGEVTELLLAEVNKGTFDAAIVATQAEMLAALDKPAPSVPADSATVEVPDEAVGNTSVPSVDGLDLSSI